MDRKLPYIRRLDTQAMEKNLKAGVKASLRKLVDSDDAEGLQEALEAERSANSKLPSKINKKHSANGCQEEEEEFSILGRRLLHYASELDAVECCKLLLRSASFPHIWVDAVDELDQCSALHVASLNHSKRCIEVLLKKGANWSLKNKHLAVPLEEALLSAKLNVDWNFVTPAEHIVEKVSRTDLAALRTLEGKCKDLLVPIAFKLAKGLKLVPLVALLIVAKSSFVLNFVTVKLEGEEESVGTLVDFLVGKVLTSWSGCSSYKVTLKRENPAGAEVVVDSKIGSDSSSWESRFETKFDHWNENSLEIKHRKDANEWEEINSKYSLSMGSEGASSISDSKSRRSCSACDEDWKGVKRVHDDCAATGEDVGTNFKIARKLLECVLLFNPRLSAHPQSPAQPPLLRAAQANDEDLLSLLLEAGAPINETDSDGNTALHWSLRQTFPVNKRSLHTTVVKRLLDAGANVLLANKLGATPVHTSAGHGHYEALKLILEKEAGGVNVMAVTKETPLHYSVKNDQLLCTALLLTHGANRNVSNLRSQKPFQLAPSPAMRALLSLDEAALREPPDNLLQSLSIMAKQQVWQEAPFQGLVWNSTGLPESCPKVDFQRAVQQLRMNGLDLIDDNGKASVKLPAWKTVSCRRFGTSEGCPWGDNCHFAHTEEELRAGAQILKTAVENSDEELGLKGLQNLDQLVANIGDQGLKKYKSKLCMYHKKGTCVLGVMCFFAHGEGELRGPISAPSRSSEEQDDSRSLGRVFVGGLPRLVHSGELRDFFEKEFGKVVHAKVIFGDDEEGRSRSRGFGFVRFEQQKDADEAVKRRCLQLSGKMVEVKRVVARMDSTSGNEVENFSTSFPSGISSPASPLYSSFSSMDIDLHSGDEVENLSPSFPSEILSPVTPLYSPPSSEPSIGLVNDAVQLPALSTTGPPPGWSIPSLPVETSQGGLHGSQLLSRRKTLPLSQSPSAFLSEQKDLHEANGEQIHPVSNRSPHLQDSAPYSQNSGPFARSFTQTSQNGVQQFPHNTRPPVEINSAPVAKPSAESKSCNVYPLSPITSSQSSSISNVFNGSARPYTSNAHENFSYFAWSFPESGIARPHYGSAQSEPAQSSQTNEADDKEFSQLVTMLKDLPPFSFGYDLTYRSQAPVASAFVSQASHLERVHNVFPAQNSDRVSPRMYTRDPPLPDNGAPLMRTYGGVSTPYLPDGFIPTQSGARVSHGMYTRDPLSLPDNGAPSSMRTYGADSTPNLPEGFKENFPSPTKYNDVGQASNSSEYHIPQVDSLGYNPHLSVGSNMASENHVSNSLEAAAPGGVGGNPSNMLRRLPPGFRSPRRGSQVSDYRRI